MKRYSLIDKFPHGYRHREDQTNLPPGVLVQGSQNVLTNVSERIQTRKGYTLDGSASTDGNPILASFDTRTKYGEEVHLRAGFLSSALNDGKLQYRFVASDGTVTWRDLMSSLTSVSFNFTSWNDSTNDLLSTLFVNGTSNIFEWNGATTTFSSATANTITKEGAESWSGIGFYDKVNTTIGGATSRFDITNTSGQTFRYTWDSTGTDPAITAKTVPTGSYILIAGQNISAVNNGLFKVTASGANYFEITNPSGLAENDKTIGTGYIYAKFTRVISLGGIDYAYTGGEGTTTLTGVTPDPTGAGLVAGDVIHQQVITTPNSGMTDIPSNFNNDLIWRIYNYLIVGSLTNTTVYQSKDLDYTTYSYSAGGRTSGQGWSYALPGCPTGFATLDDKLNISVGDNQWLTWNFVMSADLTTNEFIEVKTLKTTSRQAAKSQAMISSMKNSVIFISKEPTLDTLGTVENILGVQQTTNISDPIKLDFDAYDFGDASVFYYRYFIYVSVPKEGVILMYNLVTKSWEAPQTIPVSRFAIIDGLLYGHSYNTGETYKLFDGYNDNGNPMEAIAKFSYTTHSYPADYKNYDEVYVEGYIVPTTSLDLNVKYELDSCATDYTKTLKGDNQAYVCLTDSQASLGKVPLGKDPLGGDIEVGDETNIAKFRWFPTFIKKDFYEDQITFSSNGVDNYWEIIRFGSNAALAGKRNVKLKD